MKVLILSGNTGGGHNSCARAIKEVYDAQGDQCRVEDGIAFVSEGFSRFLSRGHSAMYRYAPWMFKYGYAYSERHPAVFHEDSGIYRVLTAGSERLYSFIREGGYEIVLCTHIFASLLLTEALKQHPELSVKTGLVITDYTCSPSTQDSCLDRYFIPDPSLCYQFECPNMPRSKMSGCGIPVRQMFYQSMPKAEAKALFGVSREHKHLLMVCGSMGCGPISHLASLLSRGLGEDCELSIVCGSNRRLCRRLRRQYRDSPGVHILGYVEDMSALLDSADLYLTKPGGLSITEAAVKKLPMVYIDAVAGCEEYNRRYFVRLGGAKTAANTRELAKLTLELLRNPEKRREMSEILKTQNNVNSAQCIYSVMNGLGEPGEDRLCS